jgi:hypothetical protein
MRLPNTNTLVPTKWDIQQWAGETNNADEEVGAAAPKFQPARPAKALHRWPRGPGQEHICSTWGTSSLASSSSSESTSLPESTSPALASPPWDVSYHITADGRCLPADTLPEDWKDGDVLREVFCGTEEELASLGGVEAFLGRVVEDDKDRAQEREEARKDWEARYGVDQDDWVSSFKRDRADDEEDKERPAKRAKVAAPAAPKTGMFFTHLVFTR